MQNWSCHFHTCPQSGFTGAFVMVPTLQQLTGSPSISLTSIQEEEGVKSISLVNSLLPRHGKKTSVFSNQAVSVLQRGLVVLIIIWAWDQSLSFFTPFLSPLLSFLKGIWRDHNKGHMCSIKLKEETTNILKGLWLRIFFGGGLPCSRDKRGNGIKSPCFCSQKEVAFQLLGAENIRSVRDSEIWVEEGDSWIQCAHAGTFRGSLSSWETSSTRHYHLCPQGPLAFTEHFHTPSHLKIPVGLLQNLLKESLYSADRPVLPTTCHLFLGWLCQVLPIIPHVNGSQLWACTAITWRTC